VVHDHMGSEHLPGRVLLLVLGYCPLFDFETLATGNWNALGILS
jgi:hypothetical protein